VTRVAEPIGQHPAVAPDVPSAAPDDDEPTVVEETQPPRLVLPGWFGGIVVFLLVWCAVAVAGGMVGLVYDFYVPALLFLGSAGVGVIVAVFLAPRPRAGQRAAHGAAAAAVGIALVFTVFVAATHSQHLLTDRDPAVYANTGRSIARTHELRPNIAIGPFADRNTFTVKGGSFAERFGNLYPNFFQGLPVVLALGFWFAHDGGMLAVPAFLGGIGLLALYALASRLIGPRWALAAMALLAGSGLQLWFARDAYSELLVQVFVLGGMWLFLEARAGRAPFAAAAIGGAILSTSIMARIDAPALIAGAVAILGIEWVRAEDTARPGRARRAIGAFAGGLAISALFAEGVTHRLNPGYLHALRGDVHLLTHLLEAVTLFTILVVVGHRFRPWAARRVARNRAFQAACLAIGGAAAVWVYFGRPEPRSQLPDLAAISNVTPALRKSFEQWHMLLSAHWFTEYFGGPAVVIGLIGFGVLVVWALRGGTAATAVLAIVLPATVLYVVRPSIGPDQPWTMRRFLPVVLPGIVIAIAVAFAWAASKLKTRWTRALLLLPALAVAIPTVQATMPFAQARAQYGAQAAVRDLCDQAGPDAAILVLKGGSFSSILPQTLRGFCGVPTATLLDPNANLSKLAVAWHQLGRRLVVVASSPASVHEAAPNAELLAHVDISDRYEIERTYDSRPKHYKPVPVSAWLYAVPPGTTG
jgi:hypothetical protein